MGEAFQCDTILVRGKLPDGKVAVVRVPATTPDAEIEAVSRPLLVAKFAAGQWYEMNTAAWLEADGNPPAVREPIHVDAAE